MRTNVRSIHHTLHRRVQRMKQCNGAHCFVAPPISLYIYIWMGVLDTRDSDAPPPSIFSSDWLHCCIYIHPLRADSAMGFDTFYTTFYCATPHHSRVSMCRRKGAGDSVSVVSLAAGVCLPEREKNCSGRIKSTVVRAVSLAAAAYICRFFCWCSRAFFSAVAHNTDHAPSAAAGTTSGDGAAKYITFILPKQKTSGDGK